MLPYKLLIICYLTIHSSVRSLKLKEILNRKDE